jgi:predicted nucleic acid-binding protein
VPQQRRDALDDRTREDPRRHVPRGARDQGGTAQELLDLHLEAPLEVAEPDRREVFRLALEYGATAYDAVFICLALANDVRLVTAERSTTRWVTRLGDRVQQVR